MIYQYIEEKPDESLFNKDLFKQIEQVYKNQVNKLVSMYDKYNNFGNDDAARLHLAQYNQVIQMYVASFDYTIVKRGGNTSDLWNISVTLEEV